MRIKLSSVLFIWRPHELSVYAETFYYYYFTNNKIFSETVFWIESHQVANMYVIYDLTLTVILVVVVVVVSFSFSLRFVVTINSTDIRYSKNVLLTLNAMLLLNIENYLNRSISTMFQPMSLYSYWIQVNVVGHAHIYTHTTLTIKLWRMLHFLVVFITIII